MDSRDFDSESEIPLLPIIPERSDNDEVENLNKTSCQICPFCQSQDFDRHNCEKYEKALYQKYCTLCQRNVHEGFMNIHLEFDCKITNFFGIKMPQPYIEPEISTDSPMIQEVYSLEEDKTTGTYDALLSVIVRWIMEFRTSGYKLISILSIK